MADQVAFPFSAEFQRKVVKLALADDSFATMALQHVTAPMFESDALRWCWQQIGAERTAQRTPTMLVLRDLVRKVDPMLQARYRAMMDAVDQDVLREDGYIRHALKEFVHRNLFVAAYHDSQRVYNAGKADQAIDLMRRATDEIQRVTFDPPARYWFYDDLAERQRQRQAAATREWEHTFPTGIVGVDEVLDGGLSLGELGCWMADAKGGKSMMLVHLAAYTARALQQRVLLILMEGSYLQTASRLDAWHAQIAFRDAKRGQFEARVLRQIQEEYRASRDRMVIRSMTDSWAYTVGDIRAELDDLKTSAGWRPKMVVVDYGDLLRSQTKNASEEEHQRNAFSDLKTLTTQDVGYSIWTASQARRPPDPLKGKEKEATTYRWGKPVLNPKDMSDSYNKVRRVDFLGSINQDQEDRENQEARLFCAIYRGGPAERLVKVKQDLAKSVFVDLLDPLNRPDMPQRVQEDLEKARAKKAAK